jgi:hypothetical protein
MSEETFSKVEVITGVARRHGLSPSLIFRWISGVDLEDVRMRVAMDMKWRVVTELMEEIHDGDLSPRDGWPFDYWAKETLQASRRDAIRYPTAFKV